MASPTLKVEQIPLVYAPKNGQNARSLKEATIVGHTTSSAPRPHVIYVVRLVYNDGSTGIVGKRYSEFLALYSSLRAEERASSSWSFPSPHGLLISLVPTAWIDDSLLEERKAGLNEFMCLLLNTEKIRSLPILSTFFRSPYSFALESLGDGLSQLTLARPRTPTQRGSLRGDRGSSPLVGTYYPSWAASSLPPSSVDWSKFDVVFFAFATPNQHGGLDWSDAGKETLKKLVGIVSRQYEGTKVVLSVGGWGGSRWFSEVIGTPAGRGAFISALAAAINSLELNGVDIDWEYPNSPGEGNPYSSVDSENLLQFLKMLRSRLGPDKIISAAVGHLPWLGSNGKPLSNVSEYAKYMTFVNIMNYDVWPASANPGPNAPLGDLCHTSSQPQANAKAAFNQWTKAGMPASKLMLGLATYGYVSRSRNTRLSGSSIPSFTPGAHPRPKNQERKRDMEVAPAGDLSSMWGGQIAFNQLVSMGALVKKANGTYGGANGYTMGWDDCSDTPFLFNTQRETVVSYDDTYSLVDKAKFAKETGMAGCFTWSLDQDDDLTLHEAVRAGLGLGR